MARDRRRTDGICEVESVGHYWNIDHTKHGSVDASMTDEVDARDTKRDERIHEHGDVGGTGSVRYARSRIVCGRTVGLSLPLSLRISNLRIDRPIRKLPRGCLAALPRLLPLLLNRVLLMLMLLRSTCRR